MRKFILVLALLASSAAFGASFSSHSYSSHSYSSHSYSAPKTYSAPKSYSSPTYTSPKPAYVTPSGGAKPYSSPTYSSTPKTSGYSYGNQSRSTNYAAGNVSNHYYGSPGFGGGNFWFWMWTFDHHGGGYGGTQMVAGSQVAGGTVVAGPSAGEQIAVVLLNVLLVCAFVALLWWAVIKWRRRY